MATIALFIALGGGAYAAFNLPKNSVKSDNIVNGQVKGADLADPGNFKSAGLADLGQLEICGNGGAPDNQWTQFHIPEYGGVGYYRDVAGLVHLQGWAIKCGTPPSGNTILILPPGYRPAFHAVFTVPPAGNDAQVEVNSTGAVVASNNSFAPILNQVEFRCAPSGQHGCP
jgi:hypothetical protein